jgi:hypothetical protein
MRVTTQKCKYSRKIRLQLVEVNMATERVIGKGNNSKRFSKCFKIESNFTKKWCCNEMFEVWNNALCLALLPIVVLHFLNINKMGYFKCWWVFNLQVKVEPKGWRQKVVVMWTQVTPICWNQHNNQTI